MNQPRPSARPAIRALYDRLAQIDPAAVAALIAPLVEDFIEAIPAALAPGRALDVGAGFGFAAQALARRGWTVTAIDLSAAMLAVAAQRPESVAYVCADLSQPPFAAASFELITASFGLNLSRPRHALPMLRRLLTGGGQLFIQEWAAQDQLFAIFDRIFAAHTGADTAFDALIAELPDDWSAQMQDTDDYYDQLRRAGFTAISVQERVPLSVPLLSSQTLLAYKLAWPNYRRRWDQLDQAAQQALSLALDSVLTARQQRLAPLLWQPVVFRAVASR